MDITKADVNNFLVWAIAAAGGGFVLFIFGALIRAAFWGDNQYARNEARFWLLAVILCVVGIIGFAWYMSLPNTRSLQ